ncbi:hypothetical protein BGZ60DRAFT_528142 [Tricladium varicosporioides]|nr:hypothetical protein BGZ60DRAFT_528142 [Hymenoscyphus varicosporioides]
MVYKYTYQPAQQRSNRLRLRGQNQTVRFALSSSSSPSDSCTTGYVYVDKRVIGVLEHFGSSILLEIERNTGCLIILPTRKASSSRSDGDEVTTVEIALKGTPKEISKAQDALYELSRVMVHYTKALLPDRKDAPLSCPKDSDLAYLRIAISTKTYRYDNVMVKKETMRGLKEMVGDTAYPEVPKEVVLYGGKEDIIKVVEWIRHWDQKVVYRKERNLMDAR